MIKRKLGSFTDSTDKQQVIDRLTTELQEYFASTNTSHGQIEVQIDNCQKLIIVSATYIDNS